MDTRILKNIVEVMEKNIDVAQKELQEQILKEGETQYTQLIQKLINDTEKAIDIWNYHQ